MQTNVNIELLLELHDQGLSLREIAKRMNMSLGAVRNQAKRLNLVSLKNLQIGSRTWTDDQLIAAVPKSDSFADVVRFLGLSDTSAGNWATVQKHIKRLQLDTTHFHGQGWVGNKNSLIPHPTRKLLEDILIENSSYRSSALLPRLVAAELKTLRCEGPNCGIENWKGKKLSFELDHMNGNHQDNRIENLRVLCPNCHSQTETWRGRKNSKKKRI